MSASPSSSSDDDEPLVPSSSSDDEKPLVPPMVPVARAPMARALKRDRQLIMPAPVPRVPRIRRRYRKRPGPIISKRKPLPHNPAVSPSLPLSPPAKRHKRGAFVTAALDAITDRARLQAPISQVRQHHSLVVIQDKFRTHLERRNAKDRPCRTHPRCAYRPWFTLLHSMPARTMVFLHSTAVFPRSRRRGALRVTHRLPAAVPHSPAPSPTISMPHGR